MSPEQWDSVLPYKATWRERRALLVTNSIVLG